MSKQDPTNAANTPHVIDDRQACQRYGVGMTQWLAMQRREGFPAPVWLGPGTKRHLTAAVDTYIETSLRERPAGSYESKARAGRLGVAKRIASRAAVCGGAER